MKVEQIQAMAPKGIILSGGPASVYEENAPRPESNPLAGSEPVPRPSPTDPLAPTGAVSFADLQSSHLNRFWPIQAALRENFRF
jgi:hypothetical protein